MTLLLASFIIFSTMSGIEHFNILGPIYDKIFGRREDQKILALAEMEQGTSLLDVGGGTGRVTHLFDRLSDKVIIADSALNMLKEAKKKNLHSVLAYSECLPFDKGAFDRIIMVDALHHVVNHTQTINELWRALTSGGRIIIEEPDYNHWFVKIIAFMEKIFLMRSHFLYPREIADLFGYSDVDQISNHFEGGIVWIIINKK